VHIDIHSALLQSSVKAKTLFKQSQTEIQIQNNDSIGTWSIHPKTGKQYEIEWNGMK